MCAMTCGFTGGIVVDYPNSAKAKKYFLVLFAGHTAQLPAGLGTTEADNPNAIRNVDRVRNSKKNRKKGGIKSKDWIMQKKERQRKQGKKVKNDSKYSGRKRVAKKI